MNGKLASQVKEDQRVVVHNFNFKILLSVLLTNSLEFVFNISLSRNIIALLVYYFI